MPLPVLSVAQMREWETATWSLGVSQESVMRRAGAAVAARVCQLTRPGESVLVLAGRGHNGDDARFAAEGLAERAVRLVNVTDPVAAAAEVRIAPAALVVDGLLGIGLNRPLDAAWNGLHRTINSRGCPVLAVDVPSGLDADTGEARGDVLRATVTVTFGAVKRGLLRTDAVPLIGRLELAHDIGLAPCPFLEADVNWTLATDFGGFPPGRCVSGHKGTFGHVVIVAGSLGFHGAAVLAASGALRAMPGLVTVLTTDAAFIPVASQISQAMVRPWKAGAALPASCSAVVFGPGLAGDDVPPGLREAMTRLWREANLPVVADASALDWLPAERIPSGSTRVITPHPGEAARLLGQSVPRVQSDRPAAVRELSRRLGGCHVVLKGHQTLCGAAFGPVIVNPTGNPGLAQGGTGDVLAGYLGGLLAQPGADASMAMRYAVFQHGRAADELSARGGAWTVAGLLARLGGTG
ncbi:MAG: NAD(P)H-hydrate dehydratase [Verrucomicrobia bacterium]|nr:NAD(P)H-hydrate dehydratase [Verrucomicrobiota bacterium]